MSESLFGDYEPDAYWIAEGTLLTLGPRDESEEIQPWACNEQDKGSPVQRRRIHMGPDATSQGHFEHDDHAEQYDTHRGGGAQRGKLMSEDYFRATAAVLERRGAVACDDRWEWWL